MNRLAPLYRLRARLALGLFVGACLGTQLWTEDSRARVEEPLKYTKVQSFRAALRFLRVDHGYEVIEKDMDSGYLLFQYPRRDAEPTPGSIEVIERKGAIALVVQLPRMPAYHERHLIQGLLKKLRDDYGDPPARSEPDRKKSPPENSDEPKAKKSAPGSPPAEAPPREP